MAQRRKILLLDDNAHFRMTLAEIFKFKDYDPVAVASGKKALEKFQKDMPSVAVIDIKLSDMSGLDVMDRLKEHAPNTECIILTGNASQESAIEAVNRGAFSYLQKPYDVEQLLVTVRRAFEKYESDQIRRKNEEALGEANTRLSNILESISDGFMILDDNFKLTYFNRAAERLLERMSHEVLNRDLFEAFPEVKGSVFEEKFSLALREKTPISFEVYFDRAPYENWYDVRVYPYSDGIAVYFQITTERKGLEAKLRQSQRLEAVGRLAGGIAHDFNNLLTIILGYSDLALQETKLSKELSDNLQEIRKSACRATALTQQLLAFSRKQILQPKMLNLNDLLTEIERLLKRLIGEDIVLSVKPDPQLGKIKADPSQLEQVIFNLAINARDAMPRGGSLTIETKNEYLDKDYSKLNPVVNAGNYIMLAVSDTGCGMNQQTKEHIFEPFFTTKDHDKGTGLGLSTVYGIVKQSGGYVWVYSEPGQGTTFKIYLPQCVVNATTSERTAEEHRSSCCGSETILVVEDEDALRNITCKILKNLGYTVYQASSGEEAQKIVNGNGKRNVELVITDVVMPELSGSELVKRLTRHNPELRVLYISGYTDDAIIRHGVSADEVSFLQKPFTARSLGQKVREVLEKG